MKTILLENDIPLLCIRAKSFPDGIMDAFGELERIAPASATCRHFGISHGSENGIVYFAAADAAGAGEALRQNGIPFTVKKGTYRAVDIPDFMRDPSQIGKTFQQLTALPGLDPEGCCVELYLNDTDVRCMVRVTE